MNSSDALAFLNQFWLTLLVLVPVVLVARAVVAGSRYSPILIIVVFGLSLGALLVATRAGAPRPRRPPRHPRRP